MSSYVIGLTGGIACGKSNLSRALRENGVPVVDADEISRAMTAPGGMALPLIREAFGSEVFDGEALDRRALSDVIFAQPAARERLNGILHPLIFAEMRRQMALVPGAVVLDVPLLFEAGMEDWCDEIWCAWVPQKEQIRRLKKREGLTVRKALQRIHSQMPTLEKRRKADHVIRTEGTKQESGLKALALWQDALRRAEAKGEKEA
ncbi:MAG: dephospho-CoA kinase [Clostridia bacterium]|nr:dephospho-CoA kinase [Clostridia bacterium]